MSAPHIQRCTVTRRFGEGRQANWWQCRLSDPHPGGPDQAHDFGIDAEVYGRDLSGQPPEWLAATLRDAAARARHQQRRIDELTAIAADLADSFDTGTPVRRVTGEWIRANTPTTAATLDERWGGNWWHS